MIKFCSFIGFLVQFALEHRYTAGSLVSVFSFPPTPTTCGYFGVCVRESADCRREVLDLQGPVHALLLQTRCRRAAAACRACRGSRSSAGLRNSFTMPAATGPSRSAPGSWVCCSAEGRSELCNMWCCKVKAASFGNLETPNQPGCFH